MLTQPIRFLAIAFLSCLLLVGCKSGDQPAVSTSGSGNSSSQLRANDLTNCRPLSERESLQEGLNITGEAVTITGIGFDNNSRCQGSPSGLSNVRGLIQPERVTMGNGLTAQVVEFELPAKDDEDPQTLKNFLVETQQGVLLYDDMEGTSFTTFNP